MIRIRRTRLRPPIGPELRAAFTTFRPALRGQRPRIAAGVAMALAITVLELAKPWPTTLMIDALVGSGDETADPPGVLPLAMIAGVALMIPAALGALTEQLQLVVARVSRKATVRIRADVFEHLHRIEVAEHDQRYRGDLLVRIMGDVNLVRDLLFPSWLNLVQRGAVVLGASLVFAAVNLELFLLAMIPLPLLWVSVERGSSAVREAAGKQRKKEGAIAARAAESLGRVGLIKAFSAEDRVVDEFRADARRAERASMAAARHSARLARRTELLTGAGVALVMLFGALQVRAGVASVGQLVLAMSYTRMIYKPLRKLTGEGPRLAKATAAANRLVEVLELPVESHGRGLRDVDLRGPIDLAGITHTYPDGRRAIDRLSAHIPMGSLVAVVGDNGAGKSTLLNLLLRLYRPTEGVIRIGGMAIEAIDLGTYRDNIAFVPQDLALFGGTIRENILFGRPDATEYEVHRAVEAALLDPVIELLPDGLDTQIGEGGATLSGGQARRVMLARAAVRDASLLLLDEPLAGLHPDARDTVARAIRRIARGRTTLVVHHGSLDELAPDRVIRLRAATSGVEPVEASS